MKVQTRENYVYSQDKKIWWNEEVSHDVVQIAVVRATNVAPRGGQVLFVGLKMGLIEAFLLFMASQHLNAVEILKVA